MHTITAPRDGQSVPTSSTLAQQVWENEGGAIVLRQVHSGAKPEYPGATRTDHARATNTDMGCHHQRHHRAQESGDGSTLGCATAIPGRNTNTAPNTLRFTGLRDDAHKDAQT